ncbi:MAG: hypothetical protein IT373_22590 [Polyangiaceae bacterium]|nr:hypothetical protein [Polyangiaceae bacterium]
MTRSLLTLLVALPVLAVLVTLAAPLGGCGEECLVYGENCSASYKQAEYGTTDIYCCSGSCQSNSFGDQVCR